MENQNLDEVIQSLGGPMIKAHANRVNDALIQSMSKPIGGSDQLRGHGELKLK